MLDAHPSRRQFAVVAAASGTHQVLGELDFVEGYLSPSRQLL